MPAGTEAARLMIFLSEDLRVGRRSVAEVLLEQARQGGLAGATIWRGIEGFGSSGRLRTARFPDASVGLPLVIELIDEPGRIDDFLPTVQRLAGGSLVTRERVTIARTGAGPSKESPDR